ncbi:unnamed protein product [Ixodes pacificus]
MKNEWKQVINADVRKHVKSSVNKKITMLLFTFMTREKPFLCLPIARPSSSPKFEHASQSQCMCAVLSKQFPNARPTRKCEL